MKYNTDNNNNNDLNEKKCSLEIDAFKIPCKKMSLHYNMTTCYLLTYKLLLNDQCIAYEIIDE